MLGPRDPDDYLLTTERRVIRVRYHWALLTRVLLETAGFVSSAVGLAYLIGQGVTFDSVVNRLSLMLVFVGLLSLLSLATLVSALLIKWFGTVDRARRFAEGMGKSLAKRAKVALLIPVVVIGIAAVLHIAGGEGGGDEAVGVLQTVLWFSALAAVLRFAYHLFEWWVERVVVTDKRFMITSGIIETKISLMPITKVTDMSYTRPIIGRLLGYGTLRLESAGQKQDLEKISFVPQPEEVYDAISELIFGEKGEGRKPSLAPPKERLKRRR